MGSARNSPLAAAVLLGVLIWPALGDGCPDDPDTDLCATTTMTPGDGCPDDPDTDLCDTTTMTPGDGCPDDPDTDLCDTTTMIPGDGCPDDPDTDLCDTTTMTTTTPIVTTTPMVPMCADDDALAVELAQGLALAGLTIGGCADTQMFCEHAMYGSRVQAICPETCGLCCADDDALAVELAQGLGLTIGGCTDVQMFCEHAMYGTTVQATCPETCGLCCADDDALAVELAQGLGLTIGGCTDVQMFCEHAMYGSTVQATCPETCDSCTRRLADGKDLNAGGLDGIEELTVVAPGTHAAASEVRQKIEESSSSDTNFLIP